MHLQCHCGFCGTQFSLDASHFPDASNDIHPKYQRSTQSSCGTFTHSLWMVAALGGAGCENQLQSACAVALPLSPPADFDPASRTSHLSLLDKQTKNELPSSRMNKVYQGSSNSIGAVTNLNSYVDSQFCGCKHVATTLSTAASAIASSRRIFVRPVCHTQPSPQVNR